MIQSSATECENKYRLFSNSRPQSTIYEVAEHHRSPSRRITCYQPCYRLQSSDIPHTKSIHHSEEIFSKCDAIIQSSHQEFMCVHERQSKPFQTALFCAYGHIYETKAHVLFFTFWRMWFNAEQMRTITQIWRIRCFALVYFDLCLDSSR